MVGWWRFLVVMSYRAVTDVALRMRTLASCRRLILDRLIAVSVAVCAAVGPASVAVQPREVPAVSRGSWFAARVVEAPAAVTVIGRDELARQASHGQLPRALAATPGAVERSSSARGIGFSPSEELTGQPRVEHTVGEGVDALRFVADGMTTVTMWVVGCPSETKH